MTLFHLFFLSLAVDFLLADSTKFSQHSYEDQIIRKILDRYKKRGKYARPVREYNTVLNVSYKMQLIQIMDLDEQDQILSLNVWDQYYWKDEHIKWNKSDFGGVDTVRIPWNKIWLPDIKLHNHADLRIQQHRKPLCVVYSTGDIQWVPQVVYKSSCPLHVYLFPFDIQNCSLKFGSWTYDGSKLDVNFYEDQNYIDLTDYVPSNAWEILDVPANRTVTRYTCCPEPFIDLKFYLIFQRKSTFYSYILVLPCVLLTSITLVQFWIPPESAAKTQLGMTIFIAFFILLKILEKYLPPGTQTMPLLGTYYCLNMIIITLSSFLSVLVTNISFYGQRAPPLPRKAKQVLFDVFAKLLFMDDLVRPLRTPKTPCFVPPPGTSQVEVNGGDKWSPDPMASTEILMQLKKEQLSQCGGPLSSIGSKLSDLKDFLRQHRERLNDKDKKEFTAKEWKAVALILDRIFFVLYLFTIAISLCSTFPILTYKVSFVPQVLERALGQ